MTMYPKIWTYGCCGSFLIQKGTHIHCLHSHLSSGIICDLNLCRSFAWCHSLHEIICVLVLLCLKDFEQRYTQKFCGVCGNWNQFFLLELSFYFWKDIQTDIHTGYNNLYSQRQCVSFLFPPHSHQHFVLFVSLIVTVVTYNINVISFVLHWRIIKIPTASMRKLFWAICQDCPRNWQSIQPIAAALGWSQRWKVNNYYWRHHILQTKAQRPWSWTWPGWLLLEA